MVARGIPLAAFRGRPVQIGEALLSFHRLRPPCGYLDRLLQPGAGKALGQGAGVGLRVVRGGVLRVGDEVRVLEPGSSGVDPGA
jgi:MOSC domain-containing protein YiiM